MHQLIYLWAALGGWYLLITTTFIRLYLSFGSFMCFVVQAEGTGSYRFHLSWLHTSPPHSSQTHFRNIPQKQRLSIIPHSHLTSTLYATGLVDRIMFTLCWFSNQSQKCIIIWMYYFMGHSSSWDTELLVNSDAAVSVAHSVFLVGRCCCHMKSTNVYTGFHACEKTVAGVCSDAQRLTSTNTSQRWAYRKAEHKHTNTHEHTQTRTHARTPTHTLLPSKFGC